MPNFCNVVLENRKKIFESFQLHDRKTSASRTQENRHVLFSLRNPSAARGFATRNTSSGRNGRNFENSTSRDIGKRAGSKVKTIAYNWHMKFKGGVTRRTGGKAGGSLNTPAVFEPLFFSRPSASLEIYISSLLLELSVYPAFF